MGSSVVLMSATLPRHRRDALIRAWGVTHHEIPALAYPRVVLTDSRGIRGASFASRPLPALRLSAVAEDVDSVIACALECVLGGGCGAVIVNSVNRAQEVYLGLRAKLGDSTALLLFHARFPADQRAEREHEVLVNFGLNGIRPQNALLVATQVAEQSLDIDFDFMVTDLAPVDLILQRAGRLHRHQRTRPTVHSEPTLFVAGLHAERLPELETTAWKYIYDPYILGRTWALLSRESVLQLPEDVDRLVQAVYGEQELPADLSESDSEFIEGEAKGAHLGKNNTERMMARNVAVDPDDEPQTAYLQKCRGYEEGEEGLGLPNYTRLGEEAITLVPVHLVAGGWSLTPHGDSFDPDRAIPDEIARSLYSRQVNVSRKALVRHFQSEETRAFAEHPILHHLKPLRLQQGCFQLGNLTVRLDDELGLVYERTLASAEDAA